MLAGPCGESRAPCCFCRGPCPSVLGSFWVIRRGSKSSQAASSAWPEITSTNLPGRGGVALLLCRLAMCFSLQGVPQEKRVSCVWLSVGVSGAPCSRGRGPRAWRERSGEGLQRSAPPSIHLRCYVTTTQPHARSYCWCHSFSAKIALKNSLGPSSNRSTAGMC